jgi:hypothetical protein
MDKSKWVNIFHILFVGTIFLYIGINREKTFKKVFDIIFYLGIIIIIFHIYKYLLKDNNKKWVNIIHILIIGPLLIYIGYHGTETSRKFFEILLILGFASIGYHLFYLLQ